MLKVNCSAEIGFFNDPQNLQLKVRNSSSLLEKQVTGTLLSESFFVWSYDRVHVT